MNKGFILLWRKLMDKGYYKKSQYVHLWIHLLYKANHTKTNFFWNGKEQILKRGQLLTGRKKLSEETGIRPGTVENILKMFENEHQIEQQKTNLFRLITIINYDKLQKSDNKIDNKMTTNEQQNDNKMTHTINVINVKNDKECKEYNANIKENKQKKSDKLKNEVQFVLDFLNKKTGKNYTNGDLIKARLENGKTVEQCKQVIINKSEDPYFLENNKKYMRPSTLFRKSHFDDYLNDIPETEEEYSKILP